MVLLQVVHEGDGVEPEVGAGELIRGAVALDLAALDLVNGRRAEGLGRLAGVAAVAHGPDIGGVVRARGRRHVRLAEQPFLDREQLVHVGGHEHDVHQALVHDLADDVEELGQVAVAELVAGPDFGREARRALAAQGEVRTRPGRAHAEGHISVLRVRDDECAGRRVGLDLGQLGFE